MSRALVTGAAGFIGSHLVDALLDRSFDVIGVDAFTPFYERGRKDANLDDARRHPAFRLVEADLRTDDLASLVDGVDVVFHLAGQPGVRLSWSDGFAEYDSCNVIATQRLLEAVKGDGHVHRLVFASSSSIYGNAARYPTGEHDMPQPHSPYAVTKLAAEHLCALYAANGGVPSIALRFFTVYGPRQRPDMAMHRLLNSALGGGPFPLYGDGEQIRDFTFVSDVVGACLRAAEVDVEPGTVVNVAGGDAHTMNEVLALVGELAESPVPIERRPASAGDVHRTGGSIERAGRLLGWSPAVGLREGLAAQLHWQRAWSSR